MDGRGMMKRGFYARVPPFNKIYNLPTNATNITRYKWQERGRTTEAMDLLEIISMIQSEKGSAAATCH